MSLVSEVNQTVAIEIWDPRSESGLMASTEVAPFCNGTPTMRMYAQMAVGVVYLMLLITTPSLSIFA
nr:hypothetical protein [uncultured Roseobacter sp.]